MTLRGIRRFTLVAAPLAVAAAMLVGPMAGTANALPKQQRCDALWEEIDDDFDTALMYTWDARDANNRGDWLAWGYYNALAGDYNQDGDDLLNIAIGWGC
jgi:hypothetical protein